MTTTHTVDGDLDWTDPFVFRYGVFAKPGDAPPPPADALLGVWERTVECPITSPDHCTLYLFYFRPASKWPRSAESVQ